MNTNMKKVWRCELTALNRTERKIRNEERRRRRAAAKEIAALQRGCARRVKALRRAVKRGFDATTQDLARLQVRRAIVAGRLSSENTASAANPAS